VTERSFAFRPRYGALAWSSIGVGGAVDAVGWVLWQRAEDCELPAAGGPVMLPKGFGVLFESIPLEIRSAIAALVARS